MTPDGLEGELRAFFDAYATAFAAGDPEVAAKCYHAPCLKVHGEGSIEALQTPQDVARFVEGVRQTHRKRGSHASHITGFRAEPIGGHAALATIDWVSLRDDGTEVRRWRRSYALARVAGEWRILAQLSHID